MRKAWIIALREYKAAVYTKAFIITLALMPLMMGGGVLANHVLKGVKDLSDRKFAIVDRSPGAKLAAELAVNVQRRNKSRTLDEKTGKQVEPNWVIEIVAPSPDNPEAILQQRFELSERVRKKELAGVLEIGKDVVTLPSLSIGDAVSAAVDLLKSGPDDDDDPKTAREKAGKLPEGIVVRYQTNNQLNQEFPTWAISNLNLAILRMRAAEAKLPVSKVAALARPVPLVNKDLTAIDKSTGKVAEGKDTNFLTTFLAPYFVLMLMFMIVMLAAQPLLQGVIEEKTNRIAEVLLGSISPFYLMAGKLIGVIGMSLTFAAVYLGGAYWAVHYFDYAQYVPKDLMGWFLLFQTLAVIMFGAVFIAVGAACNDIKEAQSLMLPVMLVLILPMMVFGHVIKEPDSALSVAMSLFPPATPLLMTVRQAIPPGVPAWQILLGASLTLLTTVALVWAAGRIFRIGLLMQGKTPSFRELTRWVIHG